MGNCSAVPQSKAQLQDYHSFHLFFNKSLISFIAAFAVVTGVAASVTPVARCDGGNQCNTGTQSCCNSVTNSNSPIVAFLKNFVDIAIPVNPSIPLGISCVGIASASS
jgi:hypothetical protein